MELVNLTQWDWWKAALIRSARTALVVAVPYLPASWSGEVPYLSILLASALGFVTAFLTAFTGLPETAGVGQPWWQAVLSRVVRTVAQAAVAGFGTAVFITDVDWAQVGSYALTAGFSSLVLACLSNLPEVPAGEPAPESEPTVVINAPVEALPEAVEATPVFDQAVAERPYNI